MFSEDKDNNIENSLSEESIELESSAEETTPEAPEEKT